MAVQSEAVGKRKGEISVRYDTPVYFQKLIPGEYDPNTGDYEEDIIKEDLRYASVTDTGEDPLRLVYDGPKQGSLTVRLQNHYRKSFDWIRIGNTRYRVDKSRELRVKQIFIVSEVQ